MYGISEEYGPGGSERALRQVGLFDFQVDTKVRLLLRARWREEGESMRLTLRLRAPLTQALMGPLDGDKIRKSLEGSLKDLGLEKVRPASLRLAQRDTTDPSVPDRRRSTSSTSTDQTVRRPCCTSQPKSISYTRRASSRSTGCRIILRWRFRSFAT